MDSSNTLDLRDQFIFSSSVGLLG